MQAGNSFSIIDKQKLFVHFNCLREFLKKNFFRWIIGNPLIHCHKSPRGSINYKYSTHAADLKLCLPGLTAWPGEYSIVYILLTYLSTSACLVCGMVFVAIYWRSQTRRLPSLRPTQAASLSLSVCLSLPPPCCCCVQVTASSSAPSHWST